MAGSAAPGAPAVVVAVPPASANATSRLPEDPVAGARSEAQWREHLREEERERKVLFDRHRLAQHRIVLASLQATRKRYDSAQTPAAVLQAERSFAQERALEQRRLEKLDRWRNSSNLSTDYDALLDIFSSAYPEARRQALAGTTSPLDTVQREVDARTKKISEWLSYVENAKTEFDGAEADRREEP